MPRARRLLRADGEGPRRRLRCHDRADETIHAYTNDQNLLDLEHKDCAGPARPRSTSCLLDRRGARHESGAGFDEGRLDGTSLRVPVPVGSITDFTAIVSSTSVDAVNAVFRAAAKVR